MTEPPLAVVAALGVPAGMRSFTVPAILGWRERAFGGPLKFMVSGAALGELIADQHPDMASRLALRGLSFRLTGGALSGHALAGPRGAAITASVAATSAYLSHAGRARLERRLSPRTAALVEDAVAIGLATAIIART